MTAAAAGIQSLAAVPHTTADMLLAAAYIPKKTAPLEAEPVAGPADGCMHRVSEHIQWTFHKQRFAVELPPWLEQESSLLPSFHQVAEVIPLGHFVSSKTITIKVVLTRTACTHLHRSHIGKRFRSPYTRAHFKRIRAISVFLGRNGKRLEINQL